MRLFKYITTQLVLMACLQVQAQSVRFAEYWFNDDYGQVVTESFNGGNDYFWSRDIPTSLLLEGMHRLNVRFRDSSGNLSGIATHHFLKINRENLPANNMFEYWYGNDFEGRKKVPLANGSEQGIILNLEIDAIPKGFHQLSFRVGVQDGIFSAPSSGYFYKYTDKDLGEVMSFEYWFDGNIETKKTVPFAGDGLARFDLSTAELTEVGMHTICYRIGRSNGSFSAVSSSYFYKSKEGANVLEYWFDNNSNAKKTIQLNGSSENLITDLNTSELSNGVHSIHIRTGQPNGSYSAETCSFFMKGENPYAPLLAQQPEEQKIVEYMYWFDDNIKTNIGASITPVKSYSFDKPILAGSLDRGEHTFSMKFKDNFGQWGETVVDTFRNTTGKVTKAYIKNLEPNLNPPGHYVKDLATIYRYYRVVDDLGEPIIGAIIDYDVEKKVMGASGTFNSFHSMPSDTSGLVVIAFDTWGKDVENDDDNYVNVGLPNPMYFKRLTLNNDTLEVVESDFGIVSIFVAQYEADEEELSLEIESSLEGSVKMASWAERSIDISDKAKIAINWSFENDFIYGNGRRKLKETKYKFENTFSGSIGAKLKTPVPLIKPSTSFENGFVSKNKIEIEMGSYLRTAYDLLSSILEANNNTDAKLFSIVKAVGSYLGEPSNIKEEISSGIVNKTGRGGTLEFGYGGVAGEISPIEAKIDLKQGVKATYEFGSTSETNSLLQAPHTKSNYIKNDMKESFDFSGGIKFGDYSDIADFKFGVGIDRAETGGTKIERKMDGRNNPIEGNITLTQGSSYDVSLEFSAASAPPWLPNEFHVLTGKEYSRKYTLKKDIFDKASLFSINDPVWQYMNSKSPQNTIGSADYIFTNLANIGDGLHSKTSDKYDVVKDNFLLKTSKKYSAGIEVAKKLELKASFIGIDWDFEISANISVEGKYPLGESYFHPYYNVIMPQVVYADVEKTRFWFSPVQHLDDLWSNCINSFTNYAAQIAEQVSEFWNKTTAFFTSDDEKGKTISNVQKPRQYANSLRSYSKLRAARQTDVSILEVHIPGNSQAFESNTQIDLEWFYPGGELLGATIEKDTIIVISDLFFLKAYHKYDTLSIAPLGNFNLYATVGQDDLSFLEIPSDYPVAVYYQPSENNNNLWKKIGVANDSISTNQLGMYCLGVNISEDKQLPVISIDKEEDAQSIDITITDNMAVFWKETYVLINGLVTEYQRNGSQLTVYLSDEQAVNDIYVTVYTKDLARNESMKTAEFFIETGVKDVRQEDCVLYPNPASSVCTLVIPVELQREQLSLAVVSTLGQVVHSNNIMSTKTTIDVSRFTNGIYFVVVYSKEGIISNQKLIKKDN